MMDIEKVYMQTPTPDETPALIAEKLAEFDAVLGSVDQKKKTGYLLAVEKCPSECNQAFKLVFLRCEVFDANNAVKRWLKYWDARIQVFGEERAFLPMTLDGAMKVDSGAARMKFVQVAAEATDPDGRGIIFFDHTQEAQSVSTEALVRCVWYFAHVALTKESCQKRGVVVYIKSLDSLSYWRPSLSKSMATAVRGILPVRIAGVHWIRPSPVIGVIISLVKPLVGKKLRNRCFHKHSGSLDDILGSLAKFGLGEKALLPVDFGGNLAFA